MSMRLISADFSIPSPDAPKALKTVQDFMSEHPDFGSERWDREAMLEAENLHELVWAMNGWTMEERNGAWEITGWESVDADGDERLYDCDDRMFALLAPFAYYCDSIRVDIDGDPVRWHVAPDGDDPGVPFILMEQEGVRTIQWQKTSQRIELLPRPVQAFPQSAQTQEGQ